MNTGISNVLLQIYDRLPLFAEEGGHNTAVDISDLINDISGVGARSTVLLTQRIFECLGLLDLNDLNKGNWRFVSFPSSLLARSILQSLADENHPLFEPRFWSQQDSNSPQSDIQRNILSSVESLRKKSQKDKAQPVRYVHVAWGLISVDGQFLLRHREDKTRNNRNNYVLIGGRVCQADLLEANSDLDTNAAVSILQSPQASNDLSAIEVALQREVTEETGLEMNQHYSYSAWRTIKPYTAVEGGGANHALTEYRIHVFHIELTQDGMLALSKRIEMDEHLTWFTANELVNAKSQDGRMAYVDALISDYASEQEWKASIFDVLSSYDPFISNLSEALAVTVSLDNQTPVQIGKTGKEKPLSCKFTKDEHSLLLTLSLYAKDPGAQVKSDSIHLLSHGWIEIDDDDLNATARELAIKLREAKMPIIEGYKERYYRLALAVDNVHFQNEAFAYLVEDCQDKKTQLKVTRKALETDLIKASSVGYTKEIAGALKLGLKELMEGKDVSGDTQKDLDTFKKNVQRLASLNQQIGLRGLIRSVDSNFKLVIGKG